MQTVLKVNGQAIPSEELWQFIVSKSGIIEDFICSYAVNQQLQAQPELLPTSDDLSDYLNQFCEVNELKDAEQFEHWLVENGEDYDIFIDRATDYIALKRLREQRIKPGAVKAWFEEQKYLFDKFVLSRLAFEDEASAEIVFEQIQSNQLSFQDAFRDYSTCDSVRLREWKELFTRAEIPAELHSKFRNPQPGSLLEGIIQMDGWWYLIYLHRFIPAMSQDLDETLQEQLQIALFKEQMDEVINKQSIEVMEVAWYQIR